MSQNPNCDEGHCSFSQGEVKLLPLPGDANLILCRSCHSHEIRWRRERNRELSQEARFPLPEWESLTKYPEE